MDVQAATLEGQVQQEVISPGSKSERCGVVLKESSGRTLVLRRQGGPAFGDSDLTRLVGHRIRADGLLTDSVFIMRNWRTTD